MIQKAVLNACDANDGVKDGVLEDPTRCKFDPKVLECKGADGAGCLTAPQVEAARKIYTPATNPRTKQEIFPALKPGSELGWAGRAGPQPNPVPISFWRYVVFKDPTGTIRPSTSTAMLPWAIGSGKISSMQRIQI